MRIEIAKVMQVGDIKIAAGVYLVGARTDVNRVTLTGAGVTHHLPAIKRPCAKRLKSTEVLYSPAGTPHVWLLMVKVPPKSELLVYLEPFDNKEKKRGKH